MYVEINEQDNPDREIRIHRNEIPEQKQTVGYSL